ncbi:MAG TPA: sulfotransferase [Acidimicrobiales bacterium]|nr:sulfotransferase [Acidimicrobiales bacterium]
MTESSSRQWAVIDRMGRRGPNVDIKVVGAGVGRTGTHSLKVALEQLVGAPCHHMMEILHDPGQVPAWMDAIDGRPVDWSAMLAQYGSIVDWPGASFWPELAQAFPNALVLLSVRDPESWYRSASDTIFPGISHMEGDGRPWMDAVQRLLRDRFSDQFDDPTAMMDAFERHNNAVRDGVPASRLLEWAPGDGWEPICERLGVPVPAEPFPITNTTADFRQMTGMPPLS